jgi:uncharacterized protein with FMN-binding domain
MRRAPLVIAATVAGTAAVFGYHPQARSVPGATAQAPATTTPAPTGSGSAATRQVTGSDVPNQYGDVQVRVTVQGKRITGVTALSLPASDGRSQQISTFAGPQLAQQAVAAQSANIDGVSGATYTSDSYKSSLQSAIDHIGTPSTSGATG